MSELTIEQWRRLPLTATIVKTDKGFVGPLTSIDAEDWLLEIGGHMVGIHECKPILRLFADMTEEERKQLAKIKYVGAHGQGMMSQRYQMMLRVAAEVDYLDSIGVDQRGWIEQGKAIREEPK